MTETNKRLTNEKKCTSFLRDMILCKDYYKRQQEISELETDQKKKMKQFEKFFKKAKDRK